MSAVLFFFLSVGIPFHLMPKKLPLFFLLIFSLSFNFSALGGDSDATPSFKHEFPGNCTENFAKSICGSGEKKAAAVKKTQANTNGGSCTDARGTAVGCCGDPVSCLGSQHLSTLQDVNNVVTQVGPGLATMLQGFGKDMSGMCKALQGLAGSGASLSLAAAAKCKGSISSCHSTCDSQIKNACDKYHIEKNQCESAKKTIRSIQCSNPPCERQKETNIKKVEENDFQPKAGPLASAINQYRNAKNDCTAQSANAKDLSENMGQMANSAISAELCKQQARHANNKEDCKKLEGHTWKDGECVPPKEEPPPTVPLSTAGGNNVISHGTTSLGAPTVETPSTESESTDGGTTGTSGGGGGGGKTTTGGDFTDDIDLPGSSSPYADESEDSDTDTAAAGKTGTGGRYSGRRGRGFSGYGGRNKRKGYTPSDDTAGGLSMGGGGFGGYGGGGFGSKGSPSSFASLGLSKKKLKELEAKKGAKRATAGESGGAHQSIFERVTKRFQVLCQDKLDCR